jgi:hypothetical protein
VIAVLSSQALQVKSIHEWFWLCSSNRLAVNEVFQPIRRVWKVTGAARRAGLTDVDCRAHPDARSCFQTPGALLKPPAAEKVALFHYATKSREDFKRKLTRGSGMSKATKDWSYFEELVGCAPQSVFCKLQSVRAASREKHCRQATAPHVPIF